MSQPTEDGITDVSALKSYNFTILKNDRILTPYPVLPALNQRVTHTLVFHATLHALKLNLVFVINKVFYKHSFIHSFNYKLISKQD